MKSLDNIAEDLFNKIRGRFPSVTIGDQDGKVTNDPLVARFFDFDYKEGDRNVGKVSISVSEEKLSVMYSNSFVEDEDNVTRQNWYNFLKELRIFAKKRLLQFDTRDITKSNLDKRDYKFLAQQQGGEQTMSESKMYGTSKISYQNIGNARLSIKHTENINQEQASGRTQKIGAIYVENADGEKFKYPYKHLNGARAMARHVAEGGKPYDDFGKHITGLSEELSNLKKFKSYINRSNVMAEGLSGYADIVAERVETIKKTISSLQKESYYKEAFEGFEAPVFEDVPDDVAENWIDQLTIRQFNEELKDVFPFVYKLVDEATRAQELSPEDLLGEADINPMAFAPSEPAGDEDFVYTVKPGDTVYSIAKRLDMSVDDIVEINGLSDASEIRVGQELRLPGDPDVMSIGASPSGGTRGIDPKDNYSADDLRKLTTGEAIEDAIEELMGQFGDSTVAEDDDPCWKGYKQIGMKKKNGKEVPNCVPESEEDTDEGNAFSKALAKAKANNDDEMEVDGKKIPVTEFILSYYDRENGTFPKGETAVLTAVEKDYGEQYINPAKAFIEAVNAKFEEFNGYKDPELMDDQAPQDYNDIKKLAGLS